MPMLVPHDLAAPADDNRVAHGVNAVEGGRAPELTHVQAVLNPLAREPTRAGNLCWSSVFRISHRIVDRYGARP